MCPSSLSSNWVKRQKVKFLCYHEDFKGLTTTFVEYLTTLLSPIYIWPSSFCISCVIYCVIKKQLYRYVTGPGSIRSDDIPIYWANKISGFIYSQMFPNSKGNQNITTHCWPDTVYEERPSLLICRPYRRNTIERRNQFTK